jgi:hypothetical protein
MKLNDVVTKFAGAPGEDIEQWLDQLAVAVRLTDDIAASKEDPTGEVAVQKKMAMVMPLLLRGSAYVTWKRLPTEAKAVYSEIAKALRRVYGKSKLAAWRELRALKLLPGEPVDVLAEQIETLLGIVGDSLPFPGQFTAVFLLDALPARIAESVRLQCGEHLELASVVNCAKTLLADPATAGTTDATAAAAAAAMSRATLDRRQHQQGEPAGAVANNGRIQCYGCRRFGHLRKDCQTRCFRCGENGHLQRNCNSAPQAGNEEARAAPPAQAALARH